MKKTLSILFTGIILTSLTIFAFALNNDTADLTAMSPDIDSSEIPVYAPGIYDINNARLVIEHIPEAELGDSPDNSRYAKMGNSPDAVPEIDSSDVPVYDVGVYDLGNGATLTVEHIPEDELFEETNPAARLHESNSELPLTPTFTWFCADEPLLPPNLKVKNNSKRNPGDLSVEVIAYNGSLNDTYYAYGIAPGDMATLSIEAPLWYNVYLAGSVRGKYNVVVTDWP